MPHTRDWDETNPPSSQAAALGATRIRDLKVDIQERMLIDHVWDSTVNDDGLHKQVTMAEQVDPASPAANYGILYFKDSGGITHLFMKDSAGTVRQLSGSLSGSVAWANITGIPAFVSFLEGLADPNLDSYLIWDDTAGDFAFRTFKAHYGGYVGSDGTTGNNLPSGWSAVRNSLGNYTVTPPGTVPVGTALGITVSLAEGGVLADIANLTLNATDFDVHINLSNDVGQLRDRAFCFNAITI